MSQSIPPRSPWFAGTPSTSNSTRDPRPSTKPLEPRMLTWPFRNRTPGARLTASSTVATAREIGVIHDRDARRGFVEELRALGRRDDRGLQLHGGCREPIVTLERVA